MFMDWITHILKTSILPKLIYRFNVIAIKNQQDLLQIYIGKIIPKFIWQVKGIRMDKTILQKTLSQRNHSPCFETSLTISTEAVWDWERDRYKDRQIRTENPNEPTLIRPTDFLTKVQLQFNRGRQSLQQLVLGQSDVHRQNNEL